MIYSTLKIFGPLRQKLLKSFRDGVRTRRQAAAAVTACGQQEEDGWLPTLVDGSCSQRSFALTLLPKSREGVKGQEGGQEALWLITAPTFCCSCAESEVEKNKVFKV